MIRATHPRAGFFSQYIYSDDISKKGNGLDLVVTKHCSIRSDEGYNCEGCYTEALYEMIARNPQFIPLKKFFVYQIGLYDDPSQWLKELISWMNHSNRPKVRANQKRIVADVLKDIIDGDFKQADVTPIVNITNNFNGGVQQVNQGGNNTMIVNYNGILDKMESDGIPPELIEEGREILKDADKSDSLKRIAGNWIKKLPFKVVEKSAEWAIKNMSKIEGYQESLLHWFASL